MTPTKSRLRVAIRGMRSGLAHPIETLDHITSQYQRARELPPIELLPDRTDPMATAHEVAGLIKCDLSCETEFRQVYSAIHDRLDTDHHHDGGVSLAEVTWVLIRHLRPEIVVETGVARGISTAFILDALHRNDAGHLWSVDLPPMRPDWRAQTAAAVDQKLSSRWTYLRGASRRRLPELLRHLKAVDVFLHDGLHTYDNMLFEFREAWPLLRHHGLLIADDANYNSAFLDFSASTGVRPILLQERDKPDIVGILRNPAEAPIDRDPCSYRPSTNRNKGIRVAALSTLDSPPDDSLDGAEIDRKGNLAQNDIRALLYQSYATTHAGSKRRRDESLGVRRDVLPHLPVSRDARIVDIGCGQGELVHQLLIQGYRHSVGVDRSPEQVQLAHSKGIFSVIEGDFSDYLCASPMPFDCVIAIDVLEHLSKSEVIDAMQTIRSGLRRGGILIARLPNSVSPFGGNYRYGDFTHETSFTPRAFLQVALVAGFTNVRSFPCPPIAHGAKSSLRALIWHVLSSMMKFTLAVETGHIHGHIITQDFVGVAQRP